MSDSLPVPGGDWEGWGAVIVKARTLLLMCGLSLAGAPAAERIPPLHGPDGWPVSPPDKGHDLRRRVPMPPVSVRDAGDGRIQIEAHDASVGQVLAALQESGLIRLSASDQLSRTVSGSYTGTLPQVLSRILDGYNYFLRVTASGTELHALNPSSDANAALRSGSSDNNAALPSGVGSNVEAATAPAAAFSLSRPNPVSQARARARAQQAARTH
jgi:hypothetical protein